MEFSTAAPVSLYGSTKLASEVVALEYGAAFDFPVWINRCGVLAGAGQFGTPEQGIFAYWVNAHLRRRPLRYIGFDGTGYQVRDAFHPRDLAALLVAQMRTARVGWTARLHRRRRSGQRHVARAAHRLVRRALRAPCSGRRSGPRAVRHSLDGHGQRRGRSAISAGSSRSPLPAILEEIAQHADAASRLAGGERRMKSPPPDAPRAAPAALRRHSGPE